MKQNIGEGTCGLIMIRSFPWLKIIQSKDLCLLLIVFMSYFLNLLVHMKCLPTLKYCSHVICDTQDTTIRQHKFSQLPHTNIKGGQYDISELSITQILNVNNHNLVAKPTIRSSTR